jgi:hypothetical protein
VASVRSLRYAVLILDSLFHVFFSHMPIENQISMPKLCLLSHIIELATKSGRRPGLFQFHPTSPSSISSTSITRLFAMRGLDPCSRCLLYLAKSTLILLQGSDSHEQTALATAVVHPDNTFRAVGHTMPPTNGHHSVPRLRGSSLKASRQLRRRYRPSVWQETPSRVTTRVFCGETTTSKIADSMGPKSLYQTDLSKKLFLPNRGLHMAGQVYIVSSPILARPQGIFTICHYIWRTHDYCGTVSSSDT